MVDKIDLDSDYEEGKQLKNGEINVDYCGHGIFRNIYHNDNGWTVMIQWGTTFERFVVATETEFLDALDSAILKALNEGCPVRWLPYSV